MRYADYLTYPEAFAFSRSRGYCEKDAAFLASRSISNQEYRLTHKEVSENANEILGQPRDRRGHGIS